MHLILDNENGNKIEINVLVCRGVKTIMTSKSKGFKKLRYLVTQRIHWFCKEFVHFIAKLSLRQGKLFLAEHFAYSILAVTN